MGFIIIKFRQVFFIHDMFRNCFYLIFNTVDKVIHNPLMDFYFYSDRVFTLIYLSCNSVGCKFLLKICKGFFGFHLNEMIYGSIIFKGNDIFKRSFQNSPDHGTVDTEKFLS